MHRLQRAEAAVSCQGREKDRPVHSPRQEEERERVALMIPVLRPQESVGKSLKRDFLRSSLFSYKLG